MVGAGCTGAVVGAGAAVGGAGGEVGTACTGSGAAGTAAVVGVSGTDALGPPSVSSHSRHLPSPCSPPFFRSTISPEASMPTAADCWVMR